jgi:DNA-binding NarL/FixJ family response regulator
LITSLATTDSRSFMLFAEIVAPPSERGRVAQLEHHLWRIAAEIQGSGVLERLGTLPDPLPHPQLARLTPRQLEVLSRLARGQRVATIAQELVVTESTVRNHLSVIFDRFGVRSQTELLELLSEGAV